MTSPSRVYFIQAVTGGPIKIGVAVNVRERLKKLQMGNPSLLCVLATMPGAREDELYLHAEFACSRVRGEWFEPTARLLRLVESCVGRDGAAARWWFDWCRAWGKIGRAAARGRGMYGPRRISRDCRDAIASSRQLRATTRQSRG